MNCLHFILYLRNNNKIRFYRNISFLLLLFVFVICNFIKMRTKNRKNSKNIFNNRICTINKQIIQSVTSQQ